MTKIEIGLIAAGLTVAALSIHHANSAPTWHRQDSHVSAAVCLSDNVKMAKDWTLFDAERAAQSTGSSGFVYEDGRFVWFLHHSDGSLHAYSYATSVDGCHLAPADDDEADEG